MGSMETGRFLLYSKGQPLLRRVAGPREHQAHYVDYSHCDKVCSDVLNTSVALSVSDPCKEELEDARWFSRGEVEEAVTRIDSNPRLRVGRNNNPEEVFIAPRGAVAYSLITSWLRGN